VGEHKVPAGFEKRAPARGAWTTCWALDFILAGVSGTTTLFLSGVVLMMFAHKHEGYAVERLTPWAATTAVALAAITAVLTLSLGSGGRSVGHAVAELRVDGPGRVIAPSWRRVWRAVLIVVPFVVLAPRSFVAAVALVGLLWAVSAVRTDRRGPYEWASGLTDYSVELVRR
jgi:hypothetical protein